MLRRFTPRNDHGGFVVRSVSFVDASNPRPASSIPAHARLSGGPNHAATAKSEADIYALCDRYGYAAKYRRRGGVFGVIEIFAEDCQMIEVLTDEMQREYTNAVPIENWKMMLKAQGLPEAA